MTSEWNHFALGEITELVIDYRGKTPKKLGGDWCKQGYRALSAKNIKTGRIVQAETIRYIDESLYRKWMKDEVQRGDILITSEAPFGQIFFWDSDEKIVLSQRLFCVRIKPEYDARFIYYYMTTPEFQSELDGRATGTTVIGLRQPELMKCIIRCPEIQEQKVIAAILSSIDAKIIANEKVNDNLLEQMQTLYKSWFVNYLPFGGTMPASWTRTNIYSLANIVYGAPFASKQFNTIGNGKPIIRIRDLKDQQFATYTTEVHPKGYLLRPGDIVVGMDGEFRPYIWGNDEAWLNQRVCVFENKRPSGKAFLYFTIKPLLYAIEQTQVATTVIHIGKKDYDAFEIMLPDSATLDSFDSLTSPMIMQIVSNSLENKHLAAMRDTLLPRLMSGELDVSAVQL